MHERKYVTVENEDKSWQHFEKKLENINKENEINNLLIYESNDVIQEVEQAKECGQEKSQDISFDNEIDFATFSNVITTADLSSRFYIKRQIIVGNTSQYYNKSTRNYSNNVTHKWMIYVRANTTEPCLESYVKNVTFFLHPTYQPNDIVTIYKPPFQLIRFGWGEFPVRVQLQFIDPINKPVDIIHPLKLDQTHSGEQMLGTETVVDIELVRKEIPSDTLPSCTITCNSSTSVSTISTPPSSPSHDLPTCHSAIISLPATDSSDVVLLDHDYHHSVIANWKNETCVVNSSQSQSSFHSPLPFCDSLDTSLHSIVRHYPLYGANHSFSADSLEQYNSWKTIKRRANEWMRAVHIHKQLQQSGLHPTLTTRQIVIWCRYHGYTPLADGHAFCKVCGQQMDMSCHDNCNLTNKLSTVSDPGRLIDQLQMESTSNEQEDNCEIDVLSVSPNNTIHFTVPSDDINYRIPQCPELHWVNRTVNDVGVVLYPVSHDKMLLHVVDHMIFSACSQFLCQLLRSAVAIDIDDKSSSLSERIIVPTHIYKSILSTPQFDFLTNSGMGVLSTNWSIP